VETVMLHVVVVDDGSVCGLGSLPTDDPDPVSVANRGRITNLLRSNPGLVRPRQLVVNIDGQPCTWLPVSGLLGPWPKP
jgi:hypothetical protein